MHSSNPDVLGFALPADLRAQFFSHDQIAQIGMRVPVWQADGVDVAAGPDMVGTTVLVTGWGTELLTAQRLERMPNLRTVVHTGGSVRRIASPELWGRGVSVSSQVETNAAVVAEYSLAMIILALKAGPSTMAGYTGSRSAFDVYGLTGAGVFGRTVGLLGASRVGRQTAKLLASLNVTVLIADPFLDDDGAAALGAELVTLPELARRSDVLSLHAPGIEATRNIVDAEILALMPDGATLLNTARGMVVDTEALTVQVASGRINAILDVTEPLLLPPDHPLWSLPNVWLTPHMAGAYGADLARLGSGAFEEVRRALAGEPLRWPVDPQTLAAMA